VNSNDGKPNKVGSSCEVVTEWTRRKRMARWQMQNKSKKQKQNVVASTVKYVMKNEILERGDAQQSFWNASRLFLRLQEHRIGVVR
jgi:hypothetical protein